MRAWREVSDEARRAADSLMYTDLDGREAYAALLIEIADNGDDLLRAILVENPDVEVGRDV